MRSKLTLEQKIMIEEKIGRIPRCFDDIQWKSWLEVARLSPPPPKHGPCADCTPEYKEKMCSAGRCDWPDVEFFGGDGFRMSLCSKDLQEKLRAGLVTGDQQL
jgi:hypothetical protein